MKENALEKCKHKIKKTILKYDILQNVQIQMNKIIIGYFQDKSGG
jgi:hypothetical protein